MNCHIKYLPFRVKNYSKYGSPPPHKVYVPPHPSPPITALSPCTCPPPPIWRGTSPPPYHQGLGKTLQTLQSCRAFYLLICHVHLKKQLFNTCCMNTNVLLHLNIKMTSQSISNFSIELRAAGEFQSSSSLAY